MFRVEDVMVLRFFFMVFNLSVTFSIFLERWSTTSVHFQAL